jgi:hypothetical protein
MIPTRTDVNNSIEILDFRAALKKEKVELNWTVNSDNNNGYFFIERSADRISFTEIGKESATSQQNELINYSFNDTLPLNGISYYRIKKINFSGVITYSEIATISNKNELTQEFNILSVFPNPFIDHIKISFNVSTSSPTFVTLTGMTGNIIYSEEINSTAGNNIYQFLIKHNLPDGIYVLTVKNGNNEFSKKLFKS